MKQQTYDSLIFDMDGTLWDAVDTYAQSWNHYFRQNQIDKEITKSFLDGLMGLEEKIYLEKVIPEIEEQRRGVVYEEVIELQYRLILSHGGILYDGVTEGLSQLHKRYKLFIVSNCPKHTIKHFMEWSNIRPFITDSIAHGENYQSKHHNIKTIIEKHGLKNPLYIGDTDSDRKQSQLANIPFCFMAYGFGTSETYDHTFSSFGNFVTFLS